MGQKQIHFEGELCEVCQENLKARVGRLMRNGEEMYRATCNACHKARFSKPWLKFRKSECESCGYRPMFQGVLAVHHRDGDKDNNDEFNLMTLCHNCHQELHGLTFDLDGDTEKAESLLARFIKSYFG